MKIVVCGDSWCSSMVNDRGHFSQVLEDVYGHTVINLARGGMSTVGICFQIKQAIELAPDVIVFNQTTPGRIELIMHDNYDPALGLKNFIYSFPDETSYGNPYVGNESAAVFATVEKALKSQRGVTITDHHCEAVKLYHTFLYHPDLKQETDSWMIEYWHQQIKNHNIVPVFLKEKEYPGQHLYDYILNNPMTMKVYHTDAKTQRIVAGEIDQILKQKT